VRRVALHLERAAGMVVLAVYFVALELVLRLDERELRRRDGA